ncbi:MAG: hypothetical protein M3Z66_23645 [Chloroflexota bacterium]|nr:hypothetical protein [Chloroflexota bacterium]
MNTFRSHRRSTLAASLLLTGAGCLTMHGTGAAAAPVAHTARATTAQALILSAAEVRTVTGATFRMTGTSLTNAEISMGEHVPTATVRRYRIDGYSSSFRRGASRGVISVTDSVGRYRSLAGARWQFGVLKRLNPPPPHSTVLRLVGLGTQATGYIVTSSYLGAVAIIFRQGHYTGRVNVEQIGGKPIAAALRLAHILDAHLQGAR